LQGGLLPEQESCEVMFNYYPASKFVDCRSQPELYSFLSSFGIKNVTGAFLEQLDSKYFEIFFSLKLAVSMLANVKRIC